MTLNSSLWLLSENELVASLEAKEYGFCKETCVQILIPVWLVMGPPVLDSPKEEQVPAESECSYQQSRPHFLLTLARCALPGRVK
jgi:hypothetical protein